MENDVEDDNWSSCPMRFKGPNKISLIFVWPDE
jgi:hypothetical protein